MSQAARRNTSISVLVFIILFFFGLRFDHPRGGLSNALGPANTTIAVYLHGHEYKNGDKIIAKSEVKGGSPAVVVVMNIGPDYYDVQNQKILERVKKKDVQGKLLAIIPFLGFPFQIIGL